MLTSLKKLFSPSPLQRQAHEAYLQVVAQARQPVFYRDLGVADTVDGRFDVVALHLFLVIHRLRGETSQDAAEFIRLLSEVFFSDMDRSLREMGVGDTGVARRIKNMAQAFYGRLQAYEQGLQNPEALSESLRRNLYRSETVGDKGVQGMAEYVRRNVAHLKQQDTAQLLSGSVRFLD